MTDANAMTRPVSGFFRAVVALLLLSGCVTVGPDYVPPEQTAAEKWHTEPGNGLIAAPLDRQALADWWTTLNDPLLTDLIELALADNHDLRLARARIRETRAQRGISVSEAFPTIDASGTFRRSRSSEGTGSGSEMNLYNLSFDASWELDLFGGIRRSVEAAQAELEASQEDLRDVLVSLLAEVALNYVEVRSFQTRLSIATANLMLQAETHDITRWRYEAGLTSQLDVEQSLFNLEQTRAELPTLRTGLAQATNRLAVLLGRNPGFVQGRLAEDKPIPVTTIDVAIGVPAEVLHRRPDIRRAERQLAARTAQIGVATAELYPHLSLSGSIGLETLSAGQLFTAKSQTHGGGPGFSWNIFAAGRVRQNIAVQNALQEQALLSYEAAILTALQEVENSLTAYANEQLRRKSLSAAAQAAERAVELARDQYASGLIDFQTVLESQRTLLSLQSSLTISDGQVTSNLISLYKALGGGWTDLEPIEGPAMSDTKK